MRRVAGGFYLSDTTPFTLAADNGSVYKPSDAGVWGSAVLTGRNGSNAIDFVYDQDIVAVFDGANIPKKSTDGSTWTQLGIDAPASAPSASAASGGSLVASDEYEVAYAYYNSDLNQVGNICTVASVTPSGSNLSIDVPVTASGDAQVTNIKVYARDVTAGETVLRLYDTYDNTSTTRTITSNNWDGQDEAPTDHNVSEALSFGVVWKNRWWGRDATVKNRLRFSQIFLNMAWPATFFVDIPFEHGEDISLIVPLGDVMIIFGTTTFYLIIGQTSLDFEVRPALGAQAGAFGFQAGCVIESGVAHASATGCYLYNGASDELLSYLITPAWHSFVGASSLSELELLSIVYHQAYKELRIAVPSLYPTGGRGEWILDLNRTNSPNAQGGQTGPTWFATTRTVGGYIPWDGPEPTAGDQGRLFSWSPTIVKIYEERTGTSADGSDITMEYDGYTLPFGLQVARIVDSYIEYEPSDGTLTLDLKVDGQRMGTQDVDLGTDLAKYGTAVYGTAVYGGGADRKMLPITWPLEAEGRTVQLLVKYVGQGAFKLYTYGHNATKEDIPRGI